MRSEDVQQRRAELLASQARRRQFVRGVIVFLFALDIAGAFYLRTLWEQRHGDSKSSVRAQATDAKASHDPHARPGARGLVIR